VASTPYQAYTGDLTAGINSQQTAGISGINAAAGYANPYIQNASNLASSATAPITGSTIQQYQNPYTQQVVDATTAQMRNEFGQQQASLTGNQIAQGALGGNATGVARGILGGQQGRTMASTVAGLYDKSYQQALQAAQQQQQTGLAGANAQAQYGLSGQNAALTGATAQIGAGSLQQQTEQQKLNAAYQQYQQQQAYPYQQAQWLAGMATGVGSNLGGTGTGSTTGPSPNNTGQWLGAGLSAAGLFLSDREAKEDIEHIGSLNDGQKIYRYRYKGQPGYHIGLIAQEAEKHNPDSVQRGLGGMRYVDMEEATEEAAHRRASGGGVGAQPWGGGVGWIPQMNIHGGSGAPQGHAPSLPSEKSGFDPEKIGKGLGSLGKGLGGLDWGGGWNAGLGNLSGEAWGGGSFAGGDAYGGSSASMLPGLNALDYGAGFAAGGAVDSSRAGLGYADGGAPGFDDRFGAAYGGVDPEEARYAEGEGFRTMMGNPDPFGETNRVIAHDALRRGDGIVNYSDPPVTDENGRLMGNQTSQQGVATVPPEAAVETAEDDSAPDLSVPRGRRGLAGRPPVMAADDYYRQPDAVRSQDGGRGGGGLLGLISPNASTGLITAGLGMLASRSPFLGNQIGEGGLAGLSAYGSAEEKDRQIAAEAEKLSREARKEKAKFGLDLRRQDEVERHNEASERNAAKTQERTKFVPAGQYMGEDGIFRPVAMDSSTGRLVDMATGKDMPKGAKYEGKGKDSIGGFSDSEAKDIARRYVVSGDVTDMQGIGPAARLKVSRAIRDVQKELGVSDEELAQRKVEFAGRKAGSRTLGTMEAKMGAAAFEAEGAIKLIRGVIEKLPRTSFLPFNQLMQGYSKKTLNPDQAELAARAQAIVNTYSAVMSRGANVVTDSARAHAGELLNTAYDPKTFNRILDTLQNEIDMAKQSPAKMQQFYREHYGPKAVEQGQGSAGAASAPAAPVGGFKPPPGAIPRLYQGKTYYYDPATKQPYPGQ
jgi:hypothetical protein